MTITSPLEIVPEEDEISIAPNPVRLDRGDRAVLISGLREKGGQLTVYDRNAVQVGHMSGEFDSVTWDTGRLPGGLYFVHVKTADGRRKTLRLVMVK